MLIELIQQKCYEAGSKMREQDFTRRRKMTFAGIIYFMICPAKMSSQNAPERFFRQVGLGPSMSQQAFSKARKKIKAEAAGELLRTSVTGSYHEEWKRWRGYRLMAVDGSFIQFPSDPALEYFGGLEKEGAAASALASMLFDVENGIVAGAKIVPVSGNGRALAKERVRVLEKLESYERGKELIIFDRGYPSHELIKFLQDKETGYVMRIRKGFISEKKLPGGRDGYAELGKSGQRVRVIQITLPGGEKETLITNMGEERLEYG